MPFLNQKQEHEESAMTDDIILDVKNFTRFCWYSDPWGDDSGDCKCHYIHNKCGFGWYMEGGAK